MLNVGDNIFEVSPIEKIRVRCNAPVNVDAIQIAIIKYRYEEDRNDWVSYNLTGNGWVEFSGYDVLEIPICIPGNAKTWDIDTLVADFQDRVIDDLRKFLAPAPSVPIPEFP